MTEEILQTDIDLARKLMNVGCGDGEILQTLTYRGITTERGLALVQQLRLGREVQPDINSAPVVMRTARIHSSSPSISSRRSKSSREKNRSPLQRWLLILAGASVLLCVALIAVVNHRAHLGLAEAQAAANAAEPGAEVSRAMRENPASLEVQISHEGLSIAGVPVRRYNALSVMTSMLGPATRTNVIEGTDKMVYVFDGHGLLVYPGKESGDDSIVIDFEATGGINSTTHPFPGRLIISGTVVTGTSDAKALGSLEKLGLKVGENNSGLLTLKYKTLGLLFAYLKSSEQLSLVEIDFD